MKLVQMTCKNCNAPLKLEDGKMACAYCGNVFEIEKDQADIEYDNIIHAEEYILRSLTEKKSAMQEEFRRQEEEAIRRENEEQRRREEERKAAKKRALISNIKKYATLLIVIGIMFGGAKLITSMDFVKKSSEQPKVEWKTHRVSRYDVTKNEKFLDKATELAYEEEKDLYSEIIDEDGVEWSLEGEPEVVEKYLITEKDDNAIYFIYKANFISSDGRTKEIYHCIATQDFVLDSSGKVEFIEPDNSSVKSVGPSENVWNGYEDLELAHEELLMNKIMDPNINYIIFEL
ncbi:MAG: hypothetical protein J6U54_18110 [Clostridiales bacterium]|nr:hypothetical protein [Clostridiales bacterium]